MYWKKKHRDCEEKRNNEKNSEKNKWWKKQWNENIISGKKWKKTEIVQKI